jgi:hypothetical protein
MSPTLSFHGNSASTKLNRLDRIRTADRQQLSPTSASGKYQSFRDRVTSGEFRAKADVAAYAEITQDIGEKLVRWIPFGQPRATDKALTAFTGFRYLQRANLTTLREDWRQGDWRQDRSQGYRRQKREREFGRFHTQF